MSFVRARFILGDVDIHGLACVEGTGLNVGGGACLCHVQTAGEQDGIVAAHLNIVVVAASRQCKSGDGSENHILFHLSFNCLSN